MEKRRKNLAICIIGCPVWENIRGPQKFLIRFSKWLSYRDVKGVVVCGSNRKLVKSIDIDNSLMMTFEDEESALIKQLPSIIRSLLFSLISFLKIIHLNKKYQFSIIQAQDANYCAMAAIAAAKLMHVSVVLRVGAINMNVIRLLIRPKRLKKSVIARFYRGYYLLLQKETIKRSNCVISVSEEIKRYLPDIGKNVVIPNGINTTSFQAIQDLADVHEELGIPEYCFTVGYVGALSAGKGLHMLLKAFYCALQEMPQKPSTYLLIVGEGSEKRDLEVLAGKLGIRHYLRLTGFRTDVARMLSIMDLFVFPSRSEGSPAVILEAMAAGKSIITSNIPAMREIVRDGKEAILVEPGNIMGLKQAIMQLRNNSDLRTRFGERARERAKPFDVEIVHGKILEIYEKLLHNRAKSVRAI